METQVCPLYDIDENDDDSKSEEIDRGQQKGYILWKNRQYPLFEGMYTACCMQ